jgi:hypothetical protein
MYLTNLIHPFFYYAHTFFSLSIFFIPSVFFFCHSLIAQVTATITSIILTVIFNSITLEIDIIANTEQSHITKITLILSKHILLIVKQIYFIYIIFTLITIYSPKINIISIVLAITAVYSLFALISQDESTKTIENIIGSVCYIFFMIIVLCELDITYGNFIHKDLIDPHKLILSYFIPFFFTMNQEDTHKEKFKYENIITQTITAIITLTTYRLLKNKIYNIVALQEEIFANNIIKNYTLYPFIIHGWYLLLIIYLFLKGYSTHRQHIADVVKNSYRIGLVLTSMLIIAMSLQYIISMNILISICYASILSIYMIYAYIIYATTKKLIYLILLISTIILIYPGTYLYQLCYL